MAVRATDYELFKTAVRLYGPTVMPRIDITQVQLSSCGEVPGFFVVRFALPAQPTTRLRQHVSRLYLTQAAPNQC